MDAIEAALQKWAKSPEGQEALNRAAVDSYKAGNFGGSGTATRPPQFYALEMIRLLNEEFAAYGLDFGKYLHREDVGWTYWGDREGYRVDVFYMQDDVERSSLYPEGGYDKVYDIIALLNQGYTADNYVYGEWKRTSTVYGPHASIRSLKQRDGYFYIQSAVRQFNQLYDTEAEVFFDEDRFGSRYL